MACTEKANVTDNSDKSLNEWPTLNDVCSNTKKPSQNGSSPKNVQKNQKCNKTLLEKQNGYDSSKENEISSQNTSGRGARKKKSSNKIKWVPVPIEARPYKKRGNGRQFNDFNRANNEKKNESSDNTNGYDSGRGSARGNRFRGKRGRGYSHNWRQRREETSRGEIENGSVDLPYEAECYYNNTVYYDPYLHNAYSSAVRETELKNAIRSQIEYYFSAENLVTDIYIRRKMDSQGYVPLSLVANFYRVQHLTKDMDMIAKAVTDSSKLELVDNCKVRPVVNPLKWPLPDVQLRTDVPEFIPGQPYIAPLIDGIENLNFNNGVNADNCSQTPGEDLSSNQVCEFFPGRNDNPSVNDIYFPESTSPHEHISDNFYQESSSVTQYITNGCEFFSNTPSPDEHANRFEFCSEEVFNGVIYYAPNINASEPISNGVSYYYTSSPDEILSTGTDNSAEDQQEVLDSKSPEPTR